MNIRAFFIIGTPFLHFLALQEPPSERPELPALRAEVDAAGRSATPLLSPASPPRALPYLSTRHDLLRRLRHAECTQVCSDPVKEKALHLLGEQYALVTRQQILVAVFLIV